MGSRWTLLCGVLAFLVSFPVAALSSELFDEHLLEPQKRDLSPNIVNGTRVRGPTTYPWMAMVQDLTEDTPQDMSFCGATMIAPNLALTAAHCISDKEDPSELGVATFRWNAHVTTEEEGGIEYRVLNIIPHPNYNPTTFANDFALLLLSAPRNYGNNTPAFIPLNRNGAVPAIGSTVRTMGWGDLVRNGNGSQFLMQVDLRTSTEAQCKSLGIIMNFESPTHPAYLCAGAPARDACQGDSGGPLVRRVGNRWEQVGVVSFGHGCAKPESPVAGYARVSYAAAWIDSYIKKPPLPATTRRPATTVKPTPRPSSALSSGTFVLSLASGSRSNTGPRQFRCPRDNRTCSVVPGGGTTWDYLNWNDPASTNGIYPGQTISMLR
ncbi:trypsin-like cysteine/serine peptidase domain-containing protein [Hyaloraphidium curvatum]|nr:trypsin-like cysteine/serine peptidase domain-containing protein [Hyaloraphidium curvatum]